MPIAYKLAKSVSHSGMAVYQLVAPYLTDPKDTSWRGPMEVYRARQRAALDGIDALDLADEHKGTLRGMLEYNIAFMDKCLKAGTVTFEELERFAHGYVPFVQKAVWVAADAQVSHWMKVMDEWKKLLGDDWDKTYAATNTLYVTRQNNILFTVLVQFFGEKAMNDRVFLFETTGFTTTPDQMLDLLTRIVADRALGKVFFKDYFLMDYELLGDEGRKAVEREAQARGQKPLLPKLIPFHSHEWPFHTDPTKGEGPATLEEVK